MAKTAGTVKTASGAVIFLVEEIGDARLRCAQLKAYLKEATDLIEKSEHRDEIFEMAAHLIHGIPDTVFKMEKAMDAAAMSAARLDYEEIKQSLKPEKADELETILEDVRLRQLQRRSNQEPPMTPKQAAEQLLAIADQTEATGQVPLAQVMTLLAAIEPPQQKTASVDGHSKAAAEAFRAWAKSIETNPKRSFLATSLRSVIAASIQPTSAQVAASIYQTASSRQQVIDGFGKANPSMSKEDLEKAADMWERHQNVVKDKHASGDTVTAYPKNLSVSDNTVGTAQEPVAKFEKGKPADPTKDMSPEDAAEWKKQTEENKDNFKAACDTTIAAPVAPVAKFEKGKPADPTKDMSPEDAAEWKKQTEENKDNFKAASTRSWKK